MIAKRFSVTGHPAEERRLVQDAQNKPDSVHPPVVRPVQPHAPDQDCVVLRARHDVEVVHAPGDGDKACVAHGRWALPNCVVASLTGNDVGCSRATLFQGR